MSALPCQYDDGGRVLAGFRGEAPGDCVTRAIAIATGVPYIEAYRELNDLLRAESPSGTLGRRSARLGVPRHVIHRYLRDELGWTWTPTMGIGTGTTVHLAEGELPSGRLVVRVTKHVCAVVDGVVHDTHDPTRDGTRAVYGYWSDPGTSP